MKAASMAWRKITWHQNNSGSISGSVSAWQQWRQRQSESSVSAIENNESGVAVA